MENTGAVLESIGQDAPLSLLGRLGTELNVDLKYTRLIFFGTLLQLLPDAVLLASILTTPIESPCLDLPRREVQTVRASVGNGCKTTNRRI